MIKYETPRHFAIATSVKTHIANQTTTTLADIEASAEMQLYNTTIFSVVFKGSYVFLRTDNFGTRSHRVKAMGFWINFSTANHRSAAPIRKGQIFS